MAFWLRTGLEPFQGDEASGFSLWSGPSEGCCKAVTSPLLLFALAKGPDGKPNRCVCYTLALHSQDNPLLNIIIQSQVSQYSNGKWTKTGRKQIFSRKNSKKKIHTFFSVYILLSTQNLSSFWNTSSYFVQNHLFLMEVILLKMNSPLGLGFDSFSFSL